MSVSTVKIDRVKLDSKWFPISDVDQSKPAKYLYRSWINDENELYKTCVSILEVTENTAINGGWVFLQGQNVMLKNLQSSNYYKRELAGPINFL